MTDNEQTIMMMVRREDNFDGVELELPLRGNGELHEHYMPFRSIEGLSVLYESVCEQMLDGEVVNQEDSKSMQVLMDTLIYSKDGEKLLKALRGYRNWQGKSIDRIFKGEAVMQKLASAGPNDKNLASLQRQSRRIKQRLKNKS